MPIKAFNIKSVEGRRVGDRPPRNIQISHDINVSFPSIIEEGLRAEFRVVITYTGLGTITFSGDIIVAASEEEIKKVYDEWKSSGNPPPEKLTQEMYNGVLGGIIPHAFYLAKELKLPPPIPLPTVNISPKKKARKKGGEGIEVV
ncbi:hypothetical protein B6U83_02670 [Thermoplasmatales archaeon ex4484_36]|nr:MAG: hypothetical protein B6U83_02670 [Thermoplasmatales archaeon ex4484_36]RLF56275.1 MAG: hypothetical protein DRN28_00865 [Thermoplasmata archaeon]RLF76811.1 MAG: hypothetical protein DRN42_00180 [Thermoplasmata archaeon]